MLDFILLMYIYIEVKSMIGAHVVTVGITLFVMGNVNGLQLGIDLLPLMLMSQDIISYVIVK